MQEQVAMRKLGVTEVQTCALPISRDAARVLLVDRDHHAARRGMGAAHLAEALVGPAEHVGEPLPLDRQRGAQARRSEERRVGKECRSRWSPSHYKKKEFYHRPNLR